MKAFATIICSLCLIVSGTNLCLAQRYLPRQIGLAISGGTVDGFLIRDKYNRYSFFAGLSVNRYNQNRTRWVFGVDYLQKDYAYRQTILPLVQVSAGVAYMVPVVATRGRDVFFSAGASARAGYESINWGQSLLYDGASLNNRDVAFGALGLHLELEAYLSDRIVLTLENAHRLCFGSTVGTYRTLLGVGIKFMIR